MSDNVAVTEGAGTSIAADNIGGVMHQRVKVGWGADGAYADASAADPLPVEMVAGSLDLAASEDHVGQVGGAAVVVRPAVTVTAGAYSAGDVVGGELTLTGAVRVTSGSGVLQSLTMHTADGETPELWVLLFDSAPGAALADNAAYAWTAGDEDKLLGAIHVETADWLTVGGDGVLSRNNLGIAVKANGGTALYAYVVCVGTPTFAATTDVTMALTFLQD